MELWTAFILGFAGSLHCAGMCGPLVLAYSRSRPRNRHASVHRVIYHLGRIAAYCLLGVAVGALGHLAPAGFQRWLSIGLGIVLLGGLWFGSRFSLSKPVWKWVQWLKGAMGGLIQKDTFASHGVLGALNGLLPCGLVYVAVVGATATGHPLTGSLYMACFGLGTWPMMLGIHFAGQRFPMPARLLQFNSARAAIMVMGILLILRGMELGIPYVSPDLSSNGGACPHCH